LNRCRSAANRCELGSLNPQFTTYRIRAVEPFLGPIKKPSDRLMLNYAPGRRVCLVEGHRPYRLHETGPLKMRK
jgi:hypothetical protein